MSAHERHSRSAAESVGRPPDPVGVTPRTAAAPPPPTCPHSGSNERMIRMADVIKITGLSRSTIYRLMSSQIFPQAYQTGPRSVAWKFTEVKEWMENLPRSRVGLSE